MVVNFGSLNAINYFMCSALNTEYTREIAAFKDMPGNTLE